MKKLLLACIFCLSGCNTTQPKYYNPEQTLSINYPDGTTFKIEGYEEKEHKITVDRSHKSLIITLSKEGFEDKKIEVPSRFTKEKWANFREGKISTFEKRGEISAIFLLPPTNTIRGTIEGAFTGLAIPMYGGLTGIIFAPFTALIGAATGFVVGASSDVYNLVYGIPSVLIKNPWYEYNNLDFSHEVLKPTSEFKIQCHQQQNMFIGNHNCLPCDIQDSVIATQEECNRCSAKRQITGVKIKGDEAVGVCALSSDFNLLSNKTKIYYGYPKDFSR